MNERKHNRNTKFAGTVGQVFPLSTDQSRKIKLDFREGHPKVAEWADRFKPEQVEARRDQPLVFLSAFLNYRGPREE